jgi:hypothetical protein
VTPVKDATLTDDEGQMAGQNRDVRIPTRRVRTISVLRRLTSPRARVRDDHGVHQRHHMNAR